MPEAYIVDAIRTPVGKKKGSLSSVHPADLGAHPDPHSLRKCRCNSTNNSSTNNNNTIIRS